jgi:hypothetical protein
LLTDIAVLGDILIGGFDTHSLEVSGENLPSMIHRLAAVEEHEATSIFNVNTFGDPDIHALMSLYLIVYMVFSGLSLSVDSFFR